MPTGVYVNGEKSQVLKRMRLRPLSQEMGFFGEVSSPETQPAEP